MIMDFKKFDIAKDSNNGAEMQVIHPGTGSEIEGCTIRLMGSDSDVYRKEIKKRAEKSLNSKSRNKKIDLDEAELKGAQLLARLTVSWKGIDEGKTAIECTFENAVKLYLEHRWLREQVEEFIGERANFMPA